MITRLQARGFRNLAPLDERFEPGIHFLFGDTGQGKTSVLEALYVVTTSRSFRTARLEHCARRATSSSGEQGSTASEREESFGGSTSALEEGFWLRAEVSSGGVRSVQELSWQPGAQPLERRVNSSSVSVSQYVGVQAVVAWSSQDLEILVGPPALRRRLLDRGVVARHPAALQAMSTYRRALEHKRSLLVAARVDRDQVRGINDLLATTAAEITTLRREFVERLERKLAAANRELGFEWDDLRVTYRPRDGSSGGRSTSRSSSGTGEPQDRQVDPLHAGRLSEATTDAPAPESDRSRLADALEDRLETEIERRRPLLGPHLDEVDFEWQGVPLAQIASAGERKALGLLLTLAQVWVLQEAERSPILLLDDLDIELDQHLLARFAPLLLAAEQTFLSSNRRAVFDGLQDRLQESSESRTGSHSETPSETLSEATIGAGETRSSGAREPASNRPLASSGSQNSWILEKGRVRGL